MPNIHGAPCFGQKHKDIFATVVAPVARWLAREAEAQDVSVSRLVCELLSQAYERSEGIAEGLEDSHAQ